MFLFFVFLILLTINLAYKPFINMLDITNREKEEMLNIRKYFKIASIIICLIILIFGNFPIFTVDQTEWAIVERFGKPIKTINNAGIQTKLPLLDKVIKVRKTTISMPFGYSVNQEKDIEVNQDESFMITGDENLIGFDLELQYKIVDPVKVLYKVSDAKEVLKNALSSSVRSVVGSATIDDVMTDKKTEISIDIRNNLTDMLKEYDMGIEIVTLNLQDADLSYSKEVDNAFKNVTNAREQKETKINEAEKIRKTEINNAKGTADALINDANAIKTKRINQAKGDVAIFNAVYSEYINNKKVTMDRLKLESIKKTLPRMKLYVTDSNSSTVKYLPLDMNMNNTNNNSTN